MVLSDMLFVGAKNDSSDLPYLSVKGNVQYQCRTTTGWQFWEVVAQWSKCWTTDGKVVSLNPGTTKLPILGPSARPLKVTNGINLHGSGLFSTQQATYRYTVWNYSSSLPWDISDKVHHLAFCTFCTVSTYTLTSTYVVLFLFIQFLTSILFIYTHSCRRRSRPGFLFHCTLYTVYSSLYVFISTFCRLHVLNQFIPFILQQA